MAKTELKDKLCAKYGVLIGLSGYSRLFLGIDPLNLKCYGVSR